MLKLSSQARVAAVASSSCLRPLALIESSTWSPASTQYTAHVVSQPFGNRLPWFSRNNSSSSSTEPSRNSSQSQSPLVNASSWDKVPHSAITQLLNSSSGLKTYGRRRYGGKKDSKVVRKELAEALLDVLGASVIEKKGTGRKLEVTKRFTHLRYPSLDEEQVTLHAVLVQLLRFSFRHRVRITPDELVRIHSYLIDHRRDFYSEFIPFAANLIDSKSQLPKIPQCRESVPSYEILLKHAHRLGDDKTLSWIGKDARHRFSREANIGRERKSEMRMIETMQNTLLRSSTARRTFQFSHTRQGGTFVRRKLDVFRHHGDVHVISRILRSRFGALKPKKRSDIESVDGRRPRLYRLSKHAAGSKQPPLHHSRSTRRLNRLVQRAMSGMEIPRPRRDTSVSGNNLSTSPVTSSKAQKISEKLLKAVGDTFPTLPSTKRKGSASLASNAQVGEEKSDLNDEKPIKTLDSITRELVSWKKMVRLWHLRRTNVVRGVMNTAAKSLTKEEENSASKRIQIPSSQALPESPSQAPLLPAWLLTAALQAQVEAGRPKAADSIVRLYLEMLYHNRSLDCDDLVHILPVDSKVIRTITNPLSPPNSPTMLNALLRTHLTNGMMDGWEFMLLLMERWCNGGENFANLVREASELPPIDRSDVAKMYKLHENVGMACLHPNETSVLIVLQSLRSRKKRSEKGFAFVKEAFSRWGLIGDLTESQDSTSTKIQYRGQNASFKPTTRTFRMLLQQAYSSNSSEGVKNTLSFFEKYVELLESKYSDMGINEYQRNLDLSLRDQVQASLYGSDPNLAFKERLKWKRVIQKGIQRSFITQDTAHKILAKDYIEE